MSPSLLPMVQEAAWLALWLSAPVLVAGALAGTLAGLLQGLTGWQEATLSHVSRVLLVAAGWAAAGPWIAGSLRAFAQAAWGGG